MHEQPSSFELDPSSPSSTQSSCRPPDGDIFLAGLLDLEYLVSKCPESVNDVDKDNWSPLAWTLDAPGYPEAVKVLVEKGKAKYRFFIEMLWARFSSLCTCEHSASHPEAIESALTHLCFTPPSFPSYTIDLSLHSVNNANFNKSF